MEDRTVNLDEEYEKLQSELAEIDRQMSKGSDGAEEEALRSAIRGIGSFLSRVNPIIFKLAKLSRGMLNVSGGRVVAPRGMAIFSYDDGEAISVIDEQQKRVSFCLKVMAEKGINGRYIAELNKSLCTLYDIYDREEELLAKVRKSCADAQNKLAVSLREKREQALKKIAAIEKRRDESFRSFLGKQSEARLANLDFPKSYDDVASINLGIDVQNRLVCNWNFNNGILYIKRNGEYSVADALKSAVLRFLFAFPGAAAQIMYCSSHMDDAVNSFLDMLNTAEVFYDDLSSAGDINNSSKMGEEVDGIKQLYKLRTSLLNRNRTDTVLNYNAATPKDIQSPILVIFQDYPNGFENCGNIEYLFKNGAKYGVYFVVTEGGKERESYSGVKQPDAKAYADVIIECVDDGKFRCGGREYDFDVPDRDVVDKCVAKIYDAKKAGRSYVTYEEIGFGDSREERAQVGAKLSFCVGKSQNKDYFLEFVTDGDGATSYAVLGNSGAGKSSLIDSMIYSGCIKYSPDDLNFYLIDFKEGASSDEYVKNARMPHIKMVASHSRPEEADVILDNILNEQKKRLELFKNYDNCKSLAKFNALMDKQGKPHLPRLIVIIDETVEMLKDGGDPARVERIIEKCGKIVEQGRSSGVHIVLSFLRIENKIKRVVELIPGRCCFKTDKDKATDFLNKDAARLMPECTNGVALVSVDLGVTFDKVKFAYVGKNGGSYYAKQVCERWSEYPINTVVIGDNSRLNFKDIASRESALSDLSGAAVGESYYTHNVVRLPFDDTNHSMLIVGSDQKTQMDYMTSVILYALKIGAQINFVDGTKISQKLHERPLYNMFKGKKGIDIALASGYMKALADACAEQTRRIKDMDNVHHPYFFIVNCLQNTLFTTNDLYIPEEDDEEDEEDAPTDAFGLDDIFAMREGSSGRSSSKNKKKTPRQEEDVRIYGSDSFNDMLRKLGRANNFFVVFSVDSPEVLRRSDASQTVRYKILHNEITYSMGSLVNASVGFRAYTDKDFCNEHLSLLFKGGTLAEKIRHISYDNDEETRKLYFDQVPDHNDD